jgi:hypothetical protein
MLRSGGLVDATINNAPSSTKEKSKACGLVLPPAKNRSDGYLGMQAHISMEGDNGVTHTSRLRRPSYMTAKCRKNL